MKTNKRTLAILTAGLLALTPMAATGMTAFAATHTLTVTDTETANHTYIAYPIILGTKNADDSLTDISWGTGINATKSTNLINALKTNAIALGITLGETPSIDDVAEALASITTADKKEKLAKILNDTTNILGTGTSLTRGTGAAANDYTATLNDGWYLIVDSSTIDNENGPFVKSANLLQIVGDLEIDAKHSLPTLEKKIVESGTEVDQNTASIGDTITYHIKTKVPDMTGYDKYFFIIEDELSAGLTYNSITDIKVVDKDDSTNVKATLTQDDDNDHTLANCDADYYVTSSGTGPTNIKIVFENVINRMSTYAVGDDIIVTYTATLDSDAVITDSGNTNKAKLIYSNDPNANNSGESTDEPDIPKNTDVKGETPEDEVKTYTTAIKIKKVDTNSNVLQGAGFTLTGVSSGQALVITNTFAESATGAYWKLKDGSFTTTSPNDSDPNLYESTSQKYGKTTSTTLKGTGQSETSITAMVGTDGYIVFQGLGAGNYTLTESPVPTGYNAIDPIDFEISATPDASSANWVLPAGFTADGDNTYLNTIENRKGSILPSTGGIGTKLFYIIGGLLVAGSVVLLVTKKRMGTREN
jgi:fimbrial isopeptide formation D2 family protein/LPXTG-motif cell wall-anchored protein